MTNPNPAAEAHASSVTVIGAGPMGRALAIALLEAGLTVTVWNRTPSAADVLVRRGATLAADPATAIAAGRLTLVNVVDHGALDEILGAAGDALTGRTIVGLTSDSPHAARATQELVIAAGGSYLDGAILTPATTGSDTARMVVAGDEAAFDGARGVLDELGTVVFVGADVTTASTIDVAALDLFWTAIGGFLHGVELARAGGLDAPDYLPYARGIAEILPAIFDDLAQRITEDRHDEPTSSITSIRRSVAHLSTASREAGLDFPALAELHRRLSETEQAGHGRDGVTRLVSRG